MGHATEHNLMRPSYYLCGIKIQKVFVCWCRIWIEGRLPLNMNMFLHFCFVFYYWNHFFFLQREITSTYRKTGLGHESNCLLIVNYNERNREKKKSFRNEVQKGPDSTTKLQAYSDIYIYCTNEYIWRLTLKNNINNKSTKATTSKTTHTTSNSQWRISFCFVIYIYIYMLFFPSVC